MGKLIFADNIYPTNNDLEVPTLRLDMQAETCEIPFVCFGEQKRTYQMDGRGTLHFYTDDYRFNYVFEHPEKIAQHNPRNIVEPNFSLFNETPMALGLQHIYKKRWIARTLQDKGIRIFVDLNVANKFYKVNLLGIPYGWSSFCTRGYSDCLINLELEYTLAKSIAGDNELRFVIYGGGDEVRKFAQSHGCVYVNHVIFLKNKSKNIMKKVEKLMKEKVFYTQSTELNNLLEQSSQLFNNQIENFNQQMLLLEQNRKDNHLEFDKQ